MDTYEKRYKEALERARTIVENKDASSVWKDWLRNTFPELAESEDERIRKVLLNDFKNSCSEYYCEGVNRDMIIAWLEKQGEQKPAWSEEDEYVLEDVEEAIINYWHGDTQDILLDWLKSLRPQSQWKPSEEQIKQLGNCIGRAWYNGDELVGLYNDLKKLKGE